MQNRQSVKIGLGQTGKRKAANLIFGCWLLGSVALLAGVSVARAQSIPDRGFQAGNAYSVSDIETVNTTNGNLMLNIPIAALPKGRGTSPGFTVALTYNSKLYNSQPEYHKDGAAQQGETGGTSYSLELLNPSESGGWHLGMDHRLRLQFRYDPNPGASFECVNSGDLQRNAYINKLHLVMPNGGETELIPVGYSDWGGDGYFNISPYGELRQVSYVDLGQGSVACSTVITQPVTTGMTYVADDGSGARVFIPPGQPRTEEPQRWTLYYPDGRTIEHHPTGDPSIRERITDRNGNQVVVKSDTFNGAGAWKIADDTGRAIFIQTSAANPAITNVYSQGVGGVWLATEVKWKGIYINRRYNAAVAGGPHGGLPSAAQTEKTVYTNLSVVESITLPPQAGSLKYEFAYNAADAPPGETDYTRWGELNSVTIPSGARAEYQYWDATEPTGVLNTTQQVLKNHLTDKTLEYKESYDGAAETTKTDAWHYVLADTSARVIAPDGGVTQQYFRGTWRNVSWDSGLVHTAALPNGTVVSKQWLNKYLVDKEFTGIGYNLTIVKDYDYDLNGNVTRVREYDFYAGALTAFPSGAVLKRETVNEYYNSAVANTDPSIKLKGLLKSTEIRDGDGATVARSEFFYDDANNTGNLTETRIWDSTKLATLLAADANGYRLTPGSYVSTATAYNAYGSPTLIADAKGNQTKITYDSTYQLFPAQTEAAYGTSIQRTSTATYDFSTGLVTSATDVDNNVTSGTDYDDLGRPTKTKTAVGTPLEVWTQTEYDDVNRRVISRSDLFVKGDGKKIAVQHYDQLGRVRLTRQIENAATEDPENEQHGVKVQTRYSTGNPHSYQLTSNPYRAATSQAATNEPSMGWTRSKAVNTGKFSEVETFSGATLPAPWGANSSPSGVVRTDTDAERTLVTDQAGKRRISRTNALGQLTDVWEVKETEAGQTEAISFGTPALSLHGLKTSYQYDTLNNLTKVIQGTQPNRNFAYSSLSRLLSAENPESGTINYQYDNNGNLTKKTDARLVETNYVYDVLNRVTSRGYANEPGGQAATPTVNYTYDVGANAKGKLIKVDNGFSKTEYQSFDVMGRVTQSQQTTDGTTYGEAMTYTYNLSGALIEQKYPSGRVVKNVLDNDGELSIVQSKKNATAGYWNYAHHFSYTAAGNISSMQLGNGRWESTEFNSRLQPTQIALGSIQNATDKLKLNFSYGTTQNNGNVLSQTITVPTVGTTQGFIATQIYTYDALNRLKSAEETIPLQTGWKQTFSYDRYGNRNFDEGGTSGNYLTTTLTRGCSTSSYNPNGICDKKKANPTFATSNHIVQDQDSDAQNDYLFDAAGNTKKDADSKTFFYDGENKQVEVKNSSGVSLGTYFYDGDGKRVKKIAGNEVMIFIYDAAGKLVAEYANQILAPSEAKVSYLTSDHLGSPRINTDANGAAIARHDYMPFGEEIDATITAQRNNNLNYGADSVKQKFTGYERDNESSLDFAQSRMFSSGVGRFTSPDSFTNDTRTSDPQSWNLYTYVRNNPLNLVDPTGKKAEYEVTVDTKNKTVTVVARATVGIWSSTYGKKDLDKVASNMKQQIEKKWNTTFKEGGWNFNFKANVTVTVHEKAKSTDDVMKETNNEVMNVIKIANLGPNVASGIDNQWQPGPTYALRPSSNNPDGTLPDTGTFDYTRASTDEPVHEFSHILGNEDRGTGGTGGTGSDLVAPGSPQASSMSRHDWNSSVGNFAMGIRNSYLSAQKSNPRLPTIYKTPPELMMMRKCCKQVIY